MTKAQRNGSVVLIIILFIALIFRILVPVLFQDRTDYSEIIAKNMRQIDSVYGNDIDKSEEPKPAYTPSLETELFIFDPNTVSYTDLLKLGLSKKTTKIFLNYRNSGAVFYKPEDVLRVYGIDSIVFLRLKRFIQIEIKNDKKTNFQNKHVRKVAQFDHKKDNKETASLNKGETSGTKKTISVIELNCADSTLLTTLPGIGPVFASRICKFREYLGGYYSVSQLLEVYKLPEETYHAIKPLLTLDTLQIKTINVNFCTINDLKKHPYCNYQQARSIVEYRAKNGSLKEVGQLLQDEVIDSVSLKKMMPYLTTNVEL